MSEPPDDDSTRLGRGPRVHSASGDLSPGAMVGNYLVESLIGRGGFATIYKGRHVTLGRYAAIKLLHPALTRSPEILKRFQQEAQAVNRIGHANIVDIFEFGELPDGRPYYVMEWLDGRDLEAHLAAHGAMSPQEALAVMEELGAALSAAHARGIVHRDLKASNVFVLPAGGWFHVKLLDFGVAKILDTATATNLTRTGIRVGTPGNMAPEQILGLPVDARTDLYALGLLLHQLLTGRLPFVAATAAELEELHLSATPPRAGALVSLPPAVDEVISRCLQKRAAERYATVDEMLRALRAAVTAPAGREQPRGQSEAALVVALGVHVEVRFADDVELDEPMLADFDRVMATARETLVAAGLTVAVNAANALFAVLPMPLAPDGERAAKLTVARTAVALAGRLAGRDDPRAGVGWALSVHVAPTITRRIDGELRYLGGELFAFAGWAAGNRLGAVTISRSAAAGIEDRLRLADAGHAPDSDDRFVLAGLR